MRNMASSVSLIYLALVGGVLPPSIALGAEIVIEDRIGIPSSTNGRGSMGSDISGFSYGATVGKYHVLQTVRLTKIDGVGVPYGVGPEPIDQYGWKLAIHSNEESALHTSLNGDVLSATSLPAPVIQAVGSNNLGWPSYLVSFDISATPGLDNVILNGNTDYWITVLGVSGVNWDWMESISAGEPDTWTVDDVFVWAWNSQPDLPTGRAALKFRGELIVPEPQVPALLLSLFGLLNSRMRLGTSFRFPSARRPTTIRASIT